MLNLKQELHLSTDLESYLLVTMNVYKYKCKLPYCGNKYFQNPYPHQNKHFFIFPKAECVRKLWCDILKSNFNIDLPTEQKKIYVCEDHFSENCFVGTERKKLHKYSVPSIFVSSNNPNFLLNKENIDPNCNNQSTDFKLASSKKQNLLEKLDQNCTDHTYSLSPKLSSNIYNEHNYFTSKH